MMLFFLLQTSIFAWKLWRIYSLIVEDNRTSTHLIWFAIPTHIYHSYIINILININYIQKIRSQVTKIRGGVCYFTNFLLLYFLVSDNFCNKTSTLNKHFINIHTCVWIYNLKFSELIVFAFFGYHLPPIQTYMYKIKKITCWQMKKKKKEAKTLIHTLK